MSPPPGTVRALMQVRPITPTELRLQVNREAGHIAAAKVQNVNQTENYAAIGRDKDEAATLAQAARDLIAAALGDVQEALDAIAEGFPDTAKTILRQLKQKLDTAEQGVRDIHAKLDAIGGAVQDGLDLEELDVTRETERSQELSVRDRRIVDWREFDRTGPGGVA